MKIRNAVGTEVREIYGSFIISMIAGEESSGAARLRTRQWPKVGIEQRAELMACWSVGLSRDYREEYPVCEDVCVLLWLSSRWVV
jgi:hypothetical protein